MPVTVGGHTLQLATGSGVFSKSGLDDGSKLLIETADFSTCRSICDLGCGWGPVGCFAAVLAPQARVWMCDINLRAVALAGLNARENKLTNASAWCGNGLSAVRPNTFDLILFNPPVRAGNAVIADLFEGAERCLSQAGVLQVVLRTAQGAKSWQKRLAQQFGNCDTIEIKAGYRILRSIKQG
jgi:16S rRNA (guanine1207-N2)-methyltransferase